MDAVVPARGSMDVVVIGPDIGPDIGTVPARDKTGVVPAAIGIGLKGRVEGLTIPMPKSEGMPDEKSLWTPGAAVARGGLAVGTGEEEGAGEASLPDA